MTTRTEFREIVAHWTASQYNVLLYQTTSPHQSSSSAQWSIQFEPYLYNRPDHLRTQTTGPVYTFYLQDSLTGNLLALLHTVINKEAKIMRSPVMAPFGGIQCAIPTPRQALSFLLECLEQWARSQQVMAITIKTPPAAYQSNQHEILHRLYQQAGYIPIEQHTNHHINISDRPFSELLSVAERRRLRKCQLAGFKPRLWHNPDPEVVYNFLNSSRQRQGYTLSLNLEKLRELLHTFTTEVLVFGVYDGKTMAALTVAIRVSQGVLYNFLPADNLLYRTYSPTVMLNEALYQFCQQEGVKVLDLGTSLDHHGQPKPGLALFKERIGGTGSPKIIYFKKLIH